MPAVSVSTKNKPLSVPEDFASALMKNIKAAAAFPKFSPSCRHEYLGWITSAKRAETRQCRITAAVKMIADGRAGR